MSRALHLVPILLAAATAHAATLIQLSMDQMTQSATAIVRARITSSSASVYTGAGGANTIYTHYTLAVSEVWKGTAPAELMLPGGSVGPQKQIFPGVPELKTGSEYVLFLWKSPTTGITHAIGLTQGIFEVGTQSDGSVAASRRQSGELMLDTSGHKVSDQPVSMALTDMKSRVRAAGPAQ